MIVKITYSAELEEVPQEVAKIITAVKKESEELFRSLGSSSKELTTEKDVKAGLIKLEKSLKVIEKLEAKLKDGHAILSGYLNILENPPKSKEDKQEQE